MQDDIIKGYIKQEYNKKIDNNTYKTVLFYENKYV